MSLNPDAQYAVVDTGSEYLLLADALVEGVLQRYFEGQTRLVKLVIDTDKLTSQYIQEWSSGSQDTFPHIYGPINLAAVLMVEPMTSSQKTI